mmetsp:Transcript_74550/g.216246  ORF Transcript_74550/g.216246 Transcript_74550/m.216246 type:complete len:204 (+) Transcript_74550:1413-2024(+)
MHLLLRRALLQRLQLRQHGLALVAKPTGLAGGPLRFGLRPLLPLHRLRQLLLHLSDTHLRLAGDLLKGHPPMQGRVASSAEVAHLAHGALQLLLLLGNRLLKDINLDARRRCLRRIGRDFGVRGVELRLQCIDGPHVILLGLRLLSPHNVKLFLDIRPCGFCCLLQLLFLLLLVLDLVLQVGDHRQQLHVIAVRRLRLRVHHC